MAWTAPVTRATGYVVLAADWNAEHVNNLLYLHGDAGTVGLTNFVAANGFFVNVAGGYLGFGAGVGLGSTVTQATSRTTAVTINTPTGQITTNGTSIANGASATFLVNNSVVTATDLIVLNVISGAIPGALMYPFVIAVSPGAFSIMYVNTSGAATTATLTIAFAVIRGSIT